MNAVSQVDFHEAKSEISAIAAKSGVLVSGVAAADAFDGAPEGRRPVDILPRASSVFVIGGAQPRAGDWQSPNYQHMEVTTTSDRIQTIALKVARVIEDQFGYYAVCVPPGVDRGQQPFMSIAMAADLAGCGSRSLAGPVLHPEFGFMYYGAIITTMPLPADGPLARLQQSALKCMTRKVPRPALPPARPMTAVVSMATLKAGASPIGHTIPPVAQPGFRTTGYRVFKKCCRQRFRNRMPRNRK